MPTLDVFKSDAFSLRALLDVLEKIPYKPGLIGQLGLFSEEGITTTVAQLEEVEGQLSLIQTSPRGAPPSNIGGDKRTMRPFNVPHLARNSRIMADEVQNVRALGSESEAQAVMPEVQKRLRYLRAMHEVTLEHMRMGAIQGTVLDADGTTLLDLFTALGVSQQTGTLDLSQTNKTLAKDLNDVRRLVENVLGGNPNMPDVGMPLYLALCGDNFFDELIVCESVIDTYRYQQGAALREDRRGGFDFGNIRWINYRGATGGTAFVNTDTAYLLPSGADIFKTYFAPADFMETVNTPGLPLYSKIAVDEKYNQWAEVHTQSNPLCICTRPDAVIELSYST